MATATMIGALQSRHAGLERDIEAELRRPLPDTEKIARMKREKLRIKDELMTVRPPQPPLDRRPRAG